MKCSLSCRKYNKRGCILTMQHAHLSFQMQRMMRISIAAITRATIPTAIGHTTKAASTAEAETKSCICTLFPDPPTLRMNEGVVYKVGILGYAGQQLYVNCVTKPDNHNIHLIRF